MGACRHTPGLLHGRQLGQRLQYVHVYRPSDIRFARGSQLPTRVTQGSSPLEICPAPAHVTAWEQRRRRPPQCAMGAPARLLLAPSRHALPQAPAAGVVPMARQPSLATDVWEGSPGLGCLPVPRACRGLQAWPPGEVCEEAPQPHACRCYLPWPPPGPAGLPAAASSWPRHSLAATAHSLLHSMVSVLGSASSSGRAAMQQSLGAARSMQQECCGPHLSSAMICVKGGRSWGSCALQQPQPPPPFDRELWRAHHANPKAQAWALQWLSRLPSPCLPAGPQVHPPPCTPWLPAASPKGPLVSSRAHQHAVMSRM